MKRKFMLLLATIFLGLFILDESTQSENKKDQARLDLQDALKYNKNYLPAQEELKKL